MEAKRTLVKSPPELWAELSDVTALARHLGEFGEIRITRTEPESVVLWEGDRASGSVRLEPAGWGTKVTLTAEATPPPPAPPASSRKGFWTRLRRRRDRGPDPPSLGPGQALGASGDRGSGPPSLAPPVASGDRGSGPLSPAPVEVVLTSALDALGSARHRPFRR